MKPLKILVLAGIVAIIALAALLYFSIQPQETPARPTRPAPYVDQVFTPSDTSKGELMAFVRKEPSIIGMSVVSLSIVANKRVTTFFYSEDINLQAAYQKYENSRTSSPDIFTKNQEFNNRISSIITGNFECLPTKKIQLATSWPIAEYAETTCAISIPPVYSEGAELIGYFSFYVKTTLSLEERARLGREAAAMASTIYKRDVR